MRSFRFLICSLGLLPFLLCGCSQEPASQTPLAPETPVLKIAVFADGRLTVNGTASTIDALRESLRSLHEQGGVVWYYREAGQQEPPPIAMEVMKAVVEVGAPIRLSSRPDYSDAIGADGRPHTK